MMIFLYLGKFIGHALHNLHALSACHCGLVSILFASSCFSWIWFLVLIKTFI